MKWEYVTHKDKMNALRKRCDKAIRTPDKHKVLSVRLNSKYISLSFLSKDLH